MCGIAGFIDDSRRNSAAELNAVAGRMSDALTHRGPDGAGVWSDPERGVALGHRRLSIIDLSEQGRQPMLSADGRYVLTYNGEIYNHRDLRAELEQQSVHFRGHSDTEVLLEAIVHWGLRETLERLNGMFAFALWDRRERRLTLVRDRLGIKPLYYSWSGSCLLFGSELKSLKAHPAFQGEIDRDVLALYLENGYVPSPCCIYRNTRKLPPGHLLQVTAATERPQTQAFWSVTEIAQNAVSDRSTGTEAERIEELHELLGDSVNVRMMADVPLGMFLSGGIDSSLVVALAQQLADRPVKTFTIGFDEPDFDESRFARPIAARLKTDHVERVVTAAEAREVIPLLPGLYDEPFADPSQIPTFLVSQLAREQVTVCLSGDGGDELFGGYSRYRHIDKIRRKIDWCPRSIRRPLAQLYDLLRRRTEPGLAARVAGSNDGCELYRSLHRHWADGGRVVLAGDPSRTEYRPAQRWADLGDFIEEMMLFDTQTYLPEDILCKVDRAGMAVGLEARVPLLDHRVVEFAWSMPPAEKHGEREGKRPLRGLLARHVPPALFERPKMGFGIPLGDWLRGPLREWGESLLAADRLSREGWFEPQPIREKWDEHLSGRRDWQYHLWNVLMFQAWREENR